MTETKHDEHETIMLNGISVDQGLTELLHAYRSQEAHGDKAVSQDHPVVIRQRNIAANVQDLEGRVKKSLGDSVKASKEQAEAMIKSLAYSLAQTEGYSGKFGEFSDEKIRTYLSQASGALGNPTIGNKIQFIESIMNLAAAKPGDPLYDSNSALAQLINYVATQKDSESKRINYLRTLFAEKWQRPGDGLELQSKIGHAFGIPLARTATAQDAFGHLERNASLEAQQYALKTGKTYLAPSTHEAHGANANADHTH